MREYLLIALRSLRHRKMRSWLTILGIIIGVASVVSLISLGSGLQNSVTKQFESFGAEKIYVIPRGVGGGPAFAMPFSEDEVTAVAKIKGVDVAAGFLVRTDVVTYQRESVPTTINSIPPKESKILFQGQGFTMREGRYFSSSDKYAIILGSLAADKLFSKELGLRSSIEIKGKKFKVVGIFKEIGNPQDDSTVYVPLDTGRELFTEPTEITTIIASAVPGSDIKKVAGDITTVLKRKRNAENFRVSTAEQLVEQVSTILNIISLVFISIAAISLFVGGIGIMNTMYTSVLERTREIGIMKAVGASSRDVMQIFLIEAGLVGTVGGAIGVVLGSGLALLVEKIAAQSLGSNLLQAYLGWPLLLFAVGFAFTVGMISGLLPAINAANMQPVEALRFE